MFGKLSILFKVLQHGNELRDKQFWKRQQCYVLPVVSGILFGLVQLAQSFGVALPLDESTCMSIAGVIYFAINTYLSLATTTVVGLPASKPAPADEPAMYGIPESPVRPLQDVAEDVAKEVVKDVQQDALAAANDWLRRNSRK